MGDSLSLLDDLLVNHQGEQDGAKDSSLRHASIDVYELCVYSINHDSLFSFTQKSRIQLIT